jgi:hypothetical protein
MADEKNPTRPATPAGGGGGTGGAGGGGAAGGGGTEKPKTLEMRVAEIEDKLSALTGGGAPCLAACFCSAGTGGGGEAAAAPCSYCYNCYSAPPCVVAEAAKPCIASQAAAAPPPPCMAAQAAALPPCVAAQAAPPCVASQASAQPCIAAAGCIADCYISRCFRCIRCIVPIFDCINECGGGCLPGPIGGGTFGGFGGFGR